MSLLVKIPFGTERSFNQWFLSIENNFNIKGNWEEFEIFSSNVCVYGILCIVLMVDITKKYQYCDIFFLAVRFSF